jgi:hypothetical protein
MARRTRFGRTQLKKFIKENQGNLYHRCLSSYDGMRDGTVDVVEDIKPIVPVLETDHNLGITGLYLVCGGGDYFDEYEDDLYKGYKWYNCCGSGLLVVLKSATPESK